jgi:hypothetical protein
MSGPPARHGRADPARSGRGCSSQCSSGTAGPRERFDVPLAELTTLGLGGLARRLIEAHTDQEAIEAVAAADATGEPLLVIGGGSNWSSPTAGSKGPPSGCSPGASK